MSFIHDDQPQEVYDAFNKFIFSSDRKLFGKLRSKIEFCEATKNIPGDVVELGVFKGSGVIAWLKALESTNLNFKRVIGFDFFSSADTINSVNTQDKDTMNDLFINRHFNPTNYDIKLANILRNAHYKNFELIKGDVTETLFDWINNNPGFRASIVNFDLDVEEPTLVCMNLLWDRLIPGGFFIFDEYAIKEWTESNAVDTFCEQHGLKVQTTKYFAPSGYIQK